MELYKHLQIMGLWYRMYLCLKDLKFLDHVKYVVSYSQVEIDHGGKQGSVLKDVLFYLKLQKSTKLKQEKWQGKLIF